MPKPKSYQILKPEDSFGYLINRTGRAIGNILKEKMEAEGIEMPMEHLIILFHLWNQDGLHQKQLVDSVFKDKTTITRALHSLEKLNMLLRVPDEQDKRSKRVFLTHKGKSLKSRVLPLALETNYKVLGNISLEHLLICKEVLNKIYQNALEG